jgi:hypothetical protein
MFVCCECFVLSEKGLWDGLITRPEESYRLWRVWSKNLEREEAKARYRAVKNTTTMGCNVRKTNKTNSNLPSTAHLFFCFEMLNSYWLVTSLVFAPFVWHTLAASPKVVFFACDYDTESHTTTHTFLGDVRSANCVVETRITALFICELPP